MNVLAELPAKDELFVALGVDEAMGWHHRVVASRSAIQAARWWLLQLGIPPLVLVSLPQLETGVENLQAIFDQNGETGVWGGWLTQGDQVRLMAVVAQNTDAASEIIMKNKQPDEDLVCIVDPSPWLALLAHCRAIHAGQALPDVDLRNVRGSFQAT